MNKTRFPRFTDEERMSEGGVRRRWFDVPRGSLPLVFYLPLRSRLTGVIDNSDLSRAVAIKVARYERISRGQYPDKVNHLDVYEYKGDEFR